MTTNRSTSSTAIRDATTGTEQDHPLERTGEEVGQSAGHLAERATDLGFARADQGRQQVASGIDQVAGSIRRVSTDLEGEQPAMANVAQTAAEQAERLAGYLRETDARQMLHTVEDVARRQPILFLGGAFLLGLAASRFLKAAGGGQTQAGRSATGYGSSYGNGYGGGYGGGTSGGYGGTYEPTGPGAGTATLDEADLAGQRGR
jgi:hypothetical protein